MRSLPWLLLVLCVSTANASTFPITSFEPDSTAHRRAPRDTVERPVWIGLQYSPVGDAAEIQQHPRRFDTAGTPWIGFGAAWPWGSSGENWLALGYARWKYSLRSEYVPFPSIVLPIINPLTTDEIVLRAGADGLIYGDRAVSGAIGGGLGFGLAYSRLGQLPGTDWTLLVDPLVHTLLRARVGRAARLGAGATTGLKYDVRHGGDPLWHWELELRLERAVGGPTATAP